MNKLPYTPKLKPALIASQIQDAHERTLALIDGLSNKQLKGPLLPIVNPLLWEIGHASYFYELWVLRKHLNQPPLIANVDSLYDSMTIAHDDRWDLPLPSIDDTLAYMQTVLDHILTSMAEGEDSVRDYLAQYAVFHQDMHNEAYTYTRQTLDYPAPFITDLDKANLGKLKPDNNNNSTLHAGGLSGDVNIPAGTFMLGATQQDGFVFDNEKWAHPVKIKPFSIAKAAVSNADYLLFVEADGYGKSEYWDDEGWKWCQKSQLQHPVYWRPTADGWEIKQFDRWHTMPINAAVIHVCWYEAQAYCRWAGRRLPSEAEWEVAAAAEPSDDGLSLSLVKRHYPWGDATPQAELANLDGFSLGTVDVAAYSAGDSAFGCRQMLGNVWEWTQDTFEPYPEFEPDMYEDYSQPLFGNTKVLRGGSWATRGRMIRNSWRTYYKPERNDVFGGFRTCALKPRFLS